MKKKTHRPKREGKEGNPKVSATLFPPSHPGSPGHPPTPPHPVHGVEGSGPLRGRTTAGPFPESGLPSGQDTHGGPLHVTTPSTTSSSPPPTLPPLSVYVYI